MTEIERLKLIREFWDQGTRQNPYQRDSDEWHDWQTGFFLALDQIDFDPKWGKITHDGLAAGQEWIEVYR